MSLSPPTTTTTPHPHPRPIPDHTTPVRPPSEHHPRFRHRGIRWWSQFSLQNTGTGWRVRAGGRDGDRVPDGQRRMRPIHSFRHQCTRGWRVERTHYHGVTTTMTPAVASPPSPDIVVPWATQPTRLPRTAHLTMLCHMPSRTPNYPYRGRYAKIACFKNLSELFVPIHLQNLSELCLNASIRKFSSELLFRPPKKPRKSPKIAKNPKIIQTSKYSIVIDLLHR